jgi:hypothetical protein
MLCQGERIRLAAMAWSLSFVSDMKMALKKKSASSVSDLQKTNNKEHIPAMTSTRKLASIEVDDRQV